MRYLGRWPEKYAGQSGSRSGRYKIFINDPAGFSAATIAGDPPMTITDELDAALALFDISGRGVYFNDDRVSK